MANSCRTVLDEAYFNDPAHRIRWQRTIEFLQGSSPSALPLSSGLDMGERTPLTALLEQHFGCPFENTAVDLDLEPLTGSFGVVTAFEVLEHLCTTGAIQRVRNLVCELHVMRGTEAKMIALMQRLMDAGMQLSLNYGAVTSGVGLAREEAPFEVIGRNHLLIELYAWRKGSACEAAQASGM